jgi:hypothetical protein
LTSKGALRLPAGGWTTVSGACDKRPQTWTVVEHEGIDYDTALGCSLNLFERLLSGLHTDPAK